MQRYDFYLSCASVWGEKLCKAREKSINLFICFSEPQPILCKSDDLMGVFNTSWVFGRAKCGIYKPKWVDYKRMSYRLRQYVQILHILGLQSVLQSRRYSLDAWLSRLYLYQIT